MGTKTYVANRMLWRDICQSAHFAGHWVALDNVRYDPSTAQPLEADVVDADLDLGELCARMRQSERTSCSIFFCDEEPFSRVVSKRPVAAPPRAAQH